MHRASGRELVTPVASYEWSVAPKGFDRYHQSHVGISPTWIGVTRLKFRKHWKEPKRCSAANGMLLSQEPTLHVSHAIFQRLATSEESGQEINSWISSAHWRYGVALFSTSQCFVGLLRSCLPRPNYIQMKGVINHWQNLTRLRRDRCSGSKSAVTWRTCHVSGRQQSVIRRDENKPDPRSHCTRKLFTAKSTVKINHQRA